MVGHNYYKVAKVPADTVHDFILAYGGLRARLGARARYEYSILYGLAGTITFSRAGAGSLH